MKEKIIKILTKYTMPSDQFGFVSVEDVAQMILEELKKDGT